MASHGDSVTVGVTTLLSVFSSALVGAFLILAPWTSWWETNFLLQANQTLRAILLSEFTRGAVSGLGLVNLLLAGLDVRSHLRGRDGLSR